MSNKTYQDETGTVLVLADVDYGEEQIDFSRNYTKRQQASDPLGSSRDPLYVGLSGRDFTSGSFTLEDARALRDWLNGLLAEYNVSENR